MYNYIFIANVCYLGYMTIGYYLTNLIVVCRVDFLK